MNIKKTNYIVLLLIILFSHILWADAIIDTILLESPSISDIAINPITNRIYLTNPSDSNLITINAETNEQKLIPLSLNARSIAINHITNKIFVACSTGYSTDGIVYMIDGITDDVTPITVGRSPVDIAVNPVTNKIYVANNENRSNDSSVVTIIDGLTYETTNVPIGRNPFAISIDAYRNNIYVVNHQSFDYKVVILNGTTLSQFPISVHDYPAYLSVNPVANKIYVPSDAGFGIIDGLTKTASSTGVIGRGDDKMTAVNPVHNVVYRSTDRSMGLYDPAIPKVTSFRVGWMYTVVSNTSTNKAYFSGKKTAIWNGIDTNSTYTIFENGSKAVALNPITNKAYFLGSDYYNPAIYVIDGSSNKLQTLAKSQKQFQTIKDLSSNYIYQCFYSESYVTRINILTGDSTRINVGTTLNLCSINPATNKLLNAKNTLLQEIDLSTGAITSSITTPFNSAFAKINPVTNCAYNVVGKLNADTSYIQKIDLNTSKATSILIPGNVTDFEIDIQNNLLYSILDNNTLLEISGNTLDIRKINLQYDVKSSIKINPVNKSIYLISSLGNRVLIYDISSGTQQSITTGNNAVLSIVNERSGEFYIVQTDPANQNDSATVTVIDTIGNLTDEIKIERNPYNIAINPVTGKVFISHSYISNDSTTVSSIAYNSKNASTFKIHRRPGLFGIDPINNILYTTNDNGFLNKVDISAKHSTKLSTTLSIPQDQILISKPSLLGTIKDSLFSSPTTANRVMYRNASNSSEWNIAEMDDSPGTNWTWNWIKDSLNYGLNYLEMVPLNALSSTVNTCGRGSFFTGDKTVIPIYRVSDNQVSNFIQKSIKSLSHNIKIQNQIVEFNVIEKSRIKVDIFNIRGQLISNLINEDKSEGRFKVSFQHLNLSNGIYFISYTDNSFSTSIKLIVK